MDALTVGVLGGFNGYILAFGLLLMAGVAASLVALALGQIGIIERDPSYPTYMALAAGALLVIAAIWRGFGRPR